VSTERILAIAVFLGCVILLIRLGPSALRSWQVYRGIGERRQEDATGQTPIAPSAVADQMALLAGLGYHRLGETRLALPVGVRFAWILAADDSESYAMILDAPRIGGLSAIYSAWLDGTWLSTMHPRGQALDRPNLQVRVVQGTFDQFVEVHREGLDRLKQVHGAPRPVRTMPDMLALDADYRTRFGGTRLRPLMIRNVLPAILVAILAVLSLVLVVVTPG
jgi:hypothetical protein